MIYYSTVRDIDESFYYYASKNGSGSDSIRSRTTLLYGSYGAALSLYTPRDPFISPVILQVEAFLSP